MTKTKSTKRALLSSVLALFLCVAMLVGTTFAWFTDSVTSANNIIKSGNLDIALYHTDDEVKEKNAGREEVTDKTKLFDDIALWEPGAVVYETLDVVNEGSLALKYQLSINVTNATTNVSGNTLSDVLKVGVIEGGAQNTDDRTAMLGEVKSWAKLTTFMKTGDLIEKLEEDSYTVVIYWEPTANDNDYNMNNGKGDPLTLDLGVTLLATQMTAESDSFDEYYDGGATWLGGVDTDWYFDDPDATEFKIGSAEQLAGLAAIVNGAVETPSTYAMNIAATTVNDDFSGKTITLASDIDLKNIAWTPIGNWDNAFCGTFDGNGHTISNLYINDPAGEGIGFFGVIDGATINGITFENVDIEAYSMVATVAGAAYPANISDCHVIGDVEIVAEWAYVAGVAGYCYYGTQVADCSVVADGMGAITSKTRNAVGGITAWLLEGKHNVTNCTVKNLNLTGWANIGGITGFVHYNNTIDGCTVENVNLTKTRADGVPSIGVVAGGYSYSAANAITLTNNTVNKATLNGTHVAYDGYDFVYGSEYGGAVTKNFVLENNKTDNITNNLVEVNKEADGIINNNGVHQIYNANGLKSLSGAKLSGNYELIADIDMGGAEFKAMSAWYASASFNGNDHTISNVKVVSGDNDNGTEQASMFFVSTKGSLTVSNLILKDITVTTKNIDNGYAAAVIGYCEGVAVMNNVDVVNVNITASKSSGMLIGHLTGTGSLTATDCDVAGTITISDFEAEGHYAGEYLGTMAGNTSLTDCTAKVTFGGNLKSTNLGTIYGRKVGGVLTVGNVETVVVATVDALQAAVDNATGTTNVVFAADITGDVKLTQKEGVKIVIDGDGHKFNGIMTVFGNGRKATAALIIKDIDFVAKNGAASCIVSPDRKVNNAYSYSSNVTVEGCTFTDPDGDVDCAAVRHEDGGDSNWKIIDCVVDNTMHSLVQVNNVELDGLTIEGCKVYSKNGINLNQCTKVSIIECEIDVKGYTVRYGVSGATVNGSFLIKDSTLKSANDDGDAVIIFRGTMTGSTLTLENTTLVGTPEITGNANVVR